MRDTKPSVKVSDRDLVPPGEYGDMGTIPKALPYCVTIKVALPSRSKLAIGAFDDRRAFECEPDGVAVFQFAEVIR